MQGHPLRPEILAMYGDNVAMKSEDTLQQYLRLEIKDLVLIGGSQASLEQIIPWILATSKNY